MGLTAQCACRSIEQVLVGMRACPRVAGVQEAGCLALNTICYKDTYNEDTEATVGVIEAALSGMCSHPGDAGLQVL